jgi:F0F1-type ATP synthase assembly protein I
VGLLANALVLAGIGALNATCWLVGIGLGWLIDDRLHTVPLFMLLGLVAGAAVGVAATYKEVRRYLYQ